MVPSRVLRRTIPAFVGKEAGTGRTGRTAHEMMAGATSVEQDMPVLAALQADLWLR